jgi:hypothetical protein
MSIAYLLLCLAVTSGKIVSMTVSSDTPEIASQFCFPSVKLGRDKGPLVSKLRPLSQINDLQS